MENKIIQKICDFFNVNFCDVIKNSRFKQCNYARNFIVLFLREKENMSNPEIANILHIQRRSVPRCYAKTKYFVERDKEYKSYYNTIKNFFS